jgi:hypothetical protein
VETGYAKGGSDAPGPVAADRGRTRARRPSRTRGARRRGGRRGEVPRAASRSAQPLPMTQVMGDGIASRAFSRRIVPSGVTVPQGWPIWCAPSAMRPDAGLRHPGSPMEGSQRLHGIGARDRTGDRSRPTQRRRRVTWLSGAPSSTRGSRVSSVPPQRVAGPRPFTVSPVTTFAPFSSL